VQVTTNLLELGKLELGILLGDGFHPWLVSIITLRRTVLGPALNERLPILHHGTCKQA